MKLGAVDYIFKLKLNAAEFLEILNEQEYEEPADEREQVVQKLVILDTEHGPISIENVQNNIRAAQLAGVFPIVRVGNLENISKALDIGAAGIQVPQVSSKKEAMEVEGIDVLFIGPYDLSQSLGVPGQTTHPEVIRQ